MADIFQSNKFVIDPEIANWSMMVVAKSNGLHPAMNLEPQRFPYTVLQIDEFTDGVKNATPCKSFVGKAEAITYAEKEAQIMIDANKEKPTW